MDYKIPLFDTNPDLNENLNNIERMLGNAWGQNAWGRMLGVRMLGVKCLGSNLDYCI
ncbi:MAG: hypothetical protein JRE64_05805 [Deltaproteobacteria bacterium]|nr:hypothetical protein [Deltaproteobacteria bacterium]